MVVRLRWRFAGTVPVSPSWRSGRPAPPRAGSSWLTRRSPGRLDE